MLGRLAKGLRASGEPEDPDVVLERVQEVPAEKAGRAENDETFELHFLAGRRAAGATRAEVSGPCRGGSFTSRSGPTLVVAAAVRDRIKELQGKGLAA